MKSFYSDINIPVQEQKRIRLVEVPSYPSNCLHATDSISVACLVLKRLFTNIRPKYRDKIKVSLPDSLYGSNRSKRSVNMFKQDMQSVHNKC